MTDLVRDWLGPEADVDGKNWLIVVNPLEVRRLSATYKHVANLPADYSGPEEQAYLIDGRELFGGEQVGEMKETQAGHKLDVHFPPVGRIASNPA